MQVSTFEMPEPNKIVNLRFIDSNHESMKTKIRIIDDLGLTLESLSAFRPHLRLGRGRNKNTMKIAELWGTKTTQNMLVRSKLTEAAQIFKYQCWKHDRKVNRLKGSPVLPHKMDRLISKSPEKMTMTEMVPAFRVYSPQVQNSGERGLETVERIGVIDGIIKNCHNFRYKSQKLLPDLNPQNDKSDNQKKKLKKNEILGIKSIMKLLDSQIL